MSRHVRGSSRAHTEAYIKASNMLELSDLVEKFTFIKRKQYKIGYLTTKLLYERKSAYDEMMKLARQHLEEPDFQRFYMLF